VSRQDRRESVIPAVRSEFALKGYFGTSTEAIATRVGVTQPYLLRLFPGKKAIVVAASTRSTEDARQACESVAKGVKGCEPSRAMGSPMVITYTRPISTHGAMTRSASIRAG